MPLGFFESFQKLYSNMSPSPSLSSVSASSVYPNKRTWGIRSSLSNAAKTRLYVVVFDGSPNSDRHFELAFLAKFIDSVDSTSSNHVYGSVVSGMLIEVVVDSSVVVEAVILVVVWIVEWEKNDFFGSLPKGEDEAVTMENPGRLLLLLGIVNAEADERSNDRSMDDDGSLPINMARGQ